MEFVDIFGGPAVLAKQLESRWLNHAVQIAQCTKNASHNVPFLSRTLSYVRSEELSLGAGKGPWQIRGREQSDKAKPSGKGSGEGPNSLPQIDILLKIFNHRTICYNDALQASSRSAALETTSDASFESEQLPSTPNETKIQRKDLASPLAKVFDDLEMAISHTVALSPNTVESKFGKAFPPYDPVEGGVWIPPEPPVTAYALFSAINHYEAQRYLSRREREDEEQVNVQLKKMWGKLNSTSLLYWKQEEVWEKQRFLHESAIFRKARREAGLDTVKREETKAEPINGEGCGAKASVAKSRGEIMPPAHVYYHYIYMERGKPVVQVERRQDYRCPLCFSRCGPDAGILIHCEISHSGSLSFEGLEDEEGNLHIAVRANLCRSISKGRGIEHLGTFTYIRSKSQPALALARPIPFFQRPVHNASRLDPAERKRKAHFLENYGADEEIVSRFIPGDMLPIRPYYHSRTNLPMLEGDWLEDSDDEPDDTWLYKMSEELMDEFDDVSSKEKIFMKIWNRFMEGSHTIVSDRSMPKRCMSFITKKGHKLAELGLRQNLFLHLCNLWDEEVLSSSHISSCMAAYDDRHKDQDSVGRDVPRGQGNQHAPNVQAHKMKRAGKKRDAPSSSNESCGKIARRKKRM